MSGYKARLQERYEKEAAPALIKQFGYKNIMEAPRLEKIVLNMGVGEAGRTGGDPKLLENAIKDMAAIKRDGNSIVIGAMARHA